MNAQLRPFLSPSRLKLLAGLLTAALLGTGAHLARSAEPLPAFHGAPASVAQRKNPLPSTENAVSAGKKLFAKNCASCHGPSAMGSGNVPGLAPAQAPAQAATDGQLFWFIHVGSPDNGMPASRLSEHERWQLIDFLRSLPGRAPISGKSSGSPAADSGSGNSAQNITQDSSPAPDAPFTDYRFENPGVIHKILAKDLPKLSVLGSLVGNGPDVVARPPGAWPKVPPGFHVQLFATGLDNPRLLRTAPNGDIFLAESESGKIRVFRGLTPDGKPKQTEVYATGLERPYGIAFYPPGKAPAWIYVGATNAVVRFAYRSGDLHATGAPLRIAALPSTSRGHWTRDLTFSEDGKKLFVAVGSASNVDDPDTTPQEKNRADILVMNPEDGTGFQVYASGIRNAGGGLAIHPTSGDLWASVNERDGLGDNLVPDYITHVQEGGYYGWPWWYIGGHQDPRHPGTHPELKDKLITPDVLLQPHHASLELAFYTATQFPEEYRGDLFSAQHGSWNRSVRTGYELVRVPLHHSAKASGEYEDFMTGFVVDASRVWGRPVGVTVAPDGSLLVSDDGSNSIWRISYTGKT